MLVFSILSDGSGVVGIPPAAMDVRPTPPHARHRAIATLKLVSTVSLFGGVILVSNLRKQSRTGKFSGREALVVPASNVLFCLLKCPVAILCNGHHRLLRLFLQSL